MLLFAVCCEIALTPLQALLLACIKKASHQLLIGSQTTFEMLGLAYLCRVELIYNTESMRAPETIEGNQFRVDGQALQVSG